MAMNIRQIRAQRPDWDGLDDAAVVDVIRQVYHPDLSSEQIASQIGVQIAPPPAPERTWGALAKDYGISALKGAISVPEAAVGLLDIPTGGRVGKFLENEGGAIGFRPKQAKAMLDEGYSDQQKQAFRNVQEADGLGGKFVAALQNPSVITHSVTESLPLMGAGGVVGRRIMAAAPRVGGIVAGGLGEGVVGAGSAASQIRQETGDGLMTAGQSGLAALSGAGTAAFGVLGNKVAKSLGLGDVDNMLMGVYANPTKAKGVVRRVLEGAASEGLLEELPQSVQEQVLQNLALGRDLSEGVDQAAVLGTLSGAAMGGGANVLSLGVQQPTQPSVEERGPLSRAANAVLATQPQVPPMAPPDTPIPDDPALVTPEPEGDLQAQIAALHDPASAKDTALITPNNDPSTLNLDGLIQVPTHRGLLVTTDPAKAEAAQAWSDDITEAEMAGLMAYGAPKAESDGTVVQAQDADGNVVHEEATTQQDAPSAAQRVADMAPEDGQVAVTDVAAVQQRRAERLNAEADMAGMLAPANPLMESVRARPEQAAEPGQTQGRFRTYEEADAFRREQNKRGATVQALPIEAPDGSFMLATKGSPEYPAAERMRADRMKAKARADAGILDGDILNKLGEPFKGRLPARNAAKKAGDAILEEYRSKVIEHFTGTDWRGRIDTWAALDASMEALAVAGKRGNTTGASIRSALTAKGFRGFDMDVIELAKQSIDALRNTPTNYFEAKPQRAVKLNEFRGAVVPRGLSQQARDVLARSGIEVVEYGKGDGAREKAIAALSKRLDKAGGGDVMMSRAVRDFRVPEVRSEDGKLLSGQKKADGLTKREATPPGKSADKQLDFGQSGLARFSESRYRPAVVAWAKDRFGDTEAPNGKPAWQNFVAWFGNSKVVDAKGRPLVVYHATTADVSVFDRGAESIFSYGDNVDAGGIFFDADPKMVDYYTSPKRRGANVNPAYLRIENPAILRGNMALDQQAAALHQAEAAGHDGAIIGELEYVVFRPEQVKSAIGNDGQFDGTNPDITMARGLRVGVQDGGEGVKLADVQAMAKRVQAVEQLVDGIKAQWQNAPDIEVVTNLQDPKVPQRVREYDAEQKSQGATGDPEGFFYKGKVYVVASQMATPQDVMRVLFHESLGHYGLRGVFGDALDGILKQMAYVRRGEVAKKAVEYGLVPDNLPADATPAQVLESMTHSQRMQAAEEVLAEMAQTRPEIGFVKRALAAIRTWLRANVPALARLRMTDAEIISNFILPARAWVERGGKGPSLRGALGVAFNRATNTPMAANDVAGQDQGGAPAGDKTWPAFDVRGTAEELAARIRRMGTSVEVAHSGSAAGKSSYLRVGGVQIEVRVSDHSKGAFQSQFYIPVFDNESAQRAYERLSEHFGGEKTEEQLQTMRDRAAQRADAEERERWEAVKPTALREGLKRLEKGKRLSNSSVRALMKDGLLPSDHPQYEPTASDGPDAMFSRADALRNPSELRGKAVQTINDLFRHTGTVSWWHKTVGTMHNLARRSPQFRRVFDGVQQFMGDVSAYATEAADLAPRLLPKLETWRDIGKSPISAEDTKAISAPIFEGTLTWARDHAGKLVKIDELERRYANFTTDEKKSMLLRMRRLSPEQVKSWLNLPPESYEGAIRNRFEREFLRPGAVFTDAELRSTFNLSDDQIGLYREFRAATDKSLDKLAITEMLRFGGEDVSDVRGMALEAGDADAVATLLADHLRGMADDQPDRASVLMDTADKIAEKAARIKDLKDRGYAPLSRFGQYTLDVLDESGERVYFGMFETKLEANRMARRMRENYPDGSITQGTVSEQAYKLFSGMTPETLELFGEMVGLEQTGDEAKDQMFQEYLKLAKANRSAMKRLIHRKGIAGFSEDAGRVLAGFIYSNARLSSTNLHTGAISRAVADIPKSQGELKDMAIKLADYIRNPQEEAQAIRGLMFTQYLGGSLASAFVNMTQPIAVTMPYLSQWGGARKAAARMRGALADVLKQSTGDARLDAALKKAEAEGIVAPQEVHHLMAQARGAATLASGDGTLKGDLFAKAMNAKSKLSLAWGKPFSAAEQFNRRVTFIAAWRTAVAEGIASPAKFAAEAINDTQFIYNKGNRPQWARGAIGATLFTFKSYSISYVELMHRLATQGGPEGKKAALFMLAMMFLMGGAGGLPFMEDAEDVVDGALQRLGYSFSTKQARKQWLIDTLGKDAAEFVESGISGLPGVPIDVAGRLGLGNLVPGTGLLTKRQSYGREVAEIAGPAGDFIKRALTGVDRIIGGDVYKGALETMPTAVRNMEKGWEMYTTGMYKDSRGRKVVDVDGYEAFIKAAGFQPRAVSEVQEGTSAQQYLIGQNKIMKAQLAERLANAVFERDPAKQQSVREQVSAWNRRNPSSPIKIDMQAVRRRVADMRRSKAERVQRSAPKAIRADVRQALMEDA